MVNSPPKTIDTTTMINNQSASVIAEFCRRVQTVIFNRSLMKTKRGNLGIVGGRKVLQDRTRRMNERKIKEGDLICILHGCSVPVILRAKEKS